MPLHLIKEIFSHPLVHRLCKGALGPLQDVGVILVLHPIGIVNVQVVSMIKTLHALCVGRQLELARAIHVKIEEQVLCSAMIIRVRHDAVLEEVGASTNRQLAC